MIVRNYGQINSLYYIKNHKKNKIFFNREIRYQKVNVF
jgi:hypothetical protein